jgi:hypothetical protein
MSWTIPDKGEGDNVAIYLLCDPCSGDPRYVGKSMNPNRRLRLHITNARIDNTTHKTHWLNGLMAMPILRIVEWCNSHVDASERERYWIAKLRGEGIKLTNSTDGGEGQPGLRHSDEARAKISRASKGHSVSMETREKIRLAHTGKQHALGKKHGQEARERHRLAALGKGPFRGHTHSVDTIAKMRAAKRGKPRSAETRAKISAAKTGVPGHTHTREHREMMRAKMTGRIFSPETIERMKIAAQRRWQTVEAV